jgi:tetratricopeptide (TPR) repeat protein
MKKNKFKGFVDKILFLFCFFSFLFGVCSSAYALDIQSVKVPFLSADYKAAILAGENLMASCSDTPELVELYYLLGISYLKDGNYLRASDIFEIILDEFKGSAFQMQAKLGLGDAWFFLADYAKAQGCYRELAAEGISLKLLPQIYYRLSECAIKLGDTDEAKKYLDKLKNEFPLNLETRVDQDLSSPDFYYTVQVGNFSKSSNADNLLNRLIKNGYSAYIEPVVAQDKRSYRVRVGKFVLRQEAIIAQDKLSGDGYPAKIFP